MKLPHPIRNLRAENRRIDRNYRATLSDQIATLNTRLLRDTTALERWKREGHHPLSLLDVQEQIHRDRGERDEHERQLRRTERQLRGRTGRTR